MTDAMVTARMPKSKKEAGNRVLESLGASASQVVNELYDYLIKNKALPWRSDEGEGRVITKEQWAEAQAWLDSMQIDLPPEFASMSIKDARTHRLAAQGLIDQGEAR